jgi:hypothetical protein
MLPDDGADGGRTGGAQDESGQVSADMTIRPAGMRPTSASDNPDAAAQYIPAETEVELENVNGQAPVGAARKAERTVAGLGFGFGLLFLVASIAVGMFAFQVPPLRTSPPHECKLAARQQETIEKELNAPESVKAYNSLIQDKGWKKIRLICDIKREMAWYTRNGGINQILSSAGTLAVILLSLATSFILGTGWSDLSRNLKATAIALPLLSAALTALMSQFHVSDIWQLRELGRIEAEALFEDSLKLDVDATTFAGDADNIRARLIDLERSQATQYFAYKFQIKADQAKAETKAAAESNKKIQPK